jgi:hypothetical protein
LLSVYLSFVLDTLDWVNVKGMLGSNAKEERGYYRRPELVDGQLSLDCEGTARRNIDHSLPLLREW